MTTEQSKSNYPSHFVSQEVKLQKPWIKKYMEAFHSECNHKPTDYGILRNNKNYSRFKQLARGENSENPYKELMGLKKSQGKLNTSFRNINFKILKVAPKIKNVLTNKVLGTDYRINVKAIDPGALSVRRTHKSKLLEFMISQEQIKQFEMLTKLGLERPVGPGEIPPSTIAEVDPYLDMTPRDMLSMEIKDYLVYSFYKNDWEQLKKEIVSDVIDFGVGGVIPYTDSSGNVRIKKIDPERSVCNQCIYPDFRDMIRFGHYSEITVSELRAITKGQLGSEEVYMDIANKVAGSSMSYTGSPQNHYNESAYSYAYDIEKVTIFEAIWISTDYEVYKEYKNETGNTRVSKESFNYVPFKGDKNVNNGKGMTDEEYNKQFIGKQKIYRKEAKNVYKGTWIVGTDHVYNFGLFDNMPREVANLWETQLPIVLMSTDFISTMGILEQGIDQVQLNYLQFQSHVAASKPPGIAIEKKALARVGVGGKAGKRWDPKEDLMLYAENGSIIFDGYDAHGNPLPYLPFKELVNGLSPGAKEHFELILAWIDFMRSQVGLNPLSEGQAPPERLGKAVAQMSFGATDNALAHLTDTYRKIYEKTAKLMFSMFQATLQSQDISEALGSESMKFFQLNNDIALKDTGILIEEGPDQYLKDKISLIVQNSVKAGEISGEDGVYIEMEDNIYRALLMISKKKREREARNHMAEQNNMRVQGEENTRTAVEAQKAKDEGEIRKLQAQKELAVTESDLRIREGDRKFLQDLILKKVDTEDKLEESDKQFVLELLKMNSTSQQNKSQQKAA